MPAVNSFFKNAVWSAQMAFSENLKIEMVFDQFLIILTKIRITKNAILSFR